MRRSQTLVASREFSVRAVRCRDDHTGWSAVEISHGYELVLVRSGRFRHAGSYGEVLADAHMGYLSGPGEEQRFSHPVGGDTCTSIEVSAALWRAVPATAAPGPVRVDALVDVTHRLMLRAATAGDVGYATTERLLRLLAGIRGGDAAPWRSAVATRTEIAMVEAAREAITARHPDSTGLVPLARMLGVSPYRLSRTFHRIMGMPLTRFRNQARISTALDRLEEGETSLARLAADLGFADQAHLTRTIRAHVGHTPGQLRRLLERPWTAGAHRQRQAASVGTESAASASERVG